MEVIDVMIENSPEAVDIVDMKCNASITERFFLVRCSVLLPQLTWTAGERNPERLKKKSDG